jgi:hypothetical protein
MSNSKKSNHKLIFAVLLMASAISANVYAGEGDNIKNYPFKDYYNDKNVVNSGKHGSLVEGFDWQDEWGSIHMNTFTDGLRDPGEPGSGPDSIIPCSQGVICSDSQVTGAVGTMPPSAVNADVIFNGIKYDFKNSFLNCASRPSPNFPSGNGGWNHPFSKFVCNLADSAIPEPDYSESDERHGKATIIYSPLYDPRSNDERANGKDRSGAGCIQQIANSCINDIHECALHDKTDSKAAYYYPTSHVFRPKEIDQLEATGMADKKLPKVFYEYTKADGSKALSATKDNYPDQKADTDATEIKTYNNKLAKIKTYRIENLGSINPDVTGFIIADPANFFNLRHYMGGGSMDAGFGAHGRMGQDQEAEKGAMFDGDGYPLTYDTCPIIGIGGYGGICDPKPHNHEQYAGCNLPVYGIGPEATVTVETKTYTDRHNPVIWSGYVKKWAWVDRKAYLENVAGRRGSNGGILYAGQTDEGVDINHPDLNDSPILMAERAPEYCDNRERYLNRVRPEDEPELPCIHYYQYQEIEIPNSDGTKDTAWTFINLFQPQFDGSFDTRYGYAYLDLFHEVEYKVQKDDGTYETKNEPYIYDKFERLGDGPKKLMPLECDSSGTCFDSGSGAGDRDYLDEDAMTSMGLDYGFDATKSYVTFMDAKIATRNKYVYDEFGTLVDTVAGKAAHFSEYCERGTPGCTNPAPQNRAGGDSIGNYIKDGDASSGTFLRLPAGKVLAVRMKVPEDAEEETSESGEERISTRCAIAMNKNMNPEASPYFIPTNSQAELDAFVNGDVTDIDFRECQSEYLSFTKSKKFGTLPAAQQAAVMANDGKNPANGTKSWFGQVKCSQLTSQPSCNNTKLITAERFCILEDGKLGDCEECMDAMNAAIDDGNIISSAGGDGQDDLLDLPAMMNDDIGGIVLASASQCFFSALCVVQDAAGCPSAATSGGHVFCLSADTKIDMADGSTKEIAQIKDGESVMAFTAKGSKSELIKAKVVATTVTRDQDYLVIDIKSKTGIKTTLEITPEHKLILPNGRAIMAQDLKRGVSILDADGKLQVVTSVKEATDRIDVHNLILEEGADGYIAEGIRVQSYPLHSELKQKMSAK